MCSRARGRVGNEKDSRKGETVGALRGRSGSSSRTENSCSCNTGDPDTDTVITSLKKRVERLQQCLLEKVSCLSMNEEFLFFDLYSVWY